jgi:hypothetical protein
VGRLAVYAEEEVTTTRLTIDFSTCRCNEMETPAAYMTDKPTGRLEKVVGGVPSGRSVAFVLNERRRFALFS